MYRYCVIDFSWGEAICTRLLIPEREPTTDQSNDCSKIKFGEPMSTFIGIAVIIIVEGKTQTATSLQSPCNMHDSSQKPPTQKALSILLTGLWSKRIFCFMCFGQGLHPRNYGFPFILLDRGYQDCQVM